MQGLSEDLLLELYRQRPALVVQCFEDADGETRGLTDEDQAALDRYNAVKDLPGFDRRGPIVIIRSDSDAEPHESGQKTPTPWKCVDENKEEAE